MHQDSGFVSAPSGFFQMSSARRTTPTVMALSATLKEGHSHRSAAWTRRKSVTDAGADPVDEVPDGAAEDPREGELEPLPVDGAPERVDEDEDEDARRRRR